MKKITHFLRSSATAQALVLFSLFPSLVLWTPSLQANPAGGIVTGGAAEIGEGLGGHLQIMQHSNRAVIDWASFSIAAGELTQFVQPGADAAVLNRVSGGTPSAIMGALQANGNVAVINTAGILVGPSGTIDVNGLLLSTLDVSNADFMAGGDMLFRGAGDAGVTNMGRINAVGGDVFLLGKTVVNSGTISAANGTVGLAAGEEVLITAVADPAGERVFVRPTAGVGGGTGVDNSGTIEGAMVELKAHGNMYALAINNSGSIRATGATKNGGKVTLRAIGGTITNSGSIAATLPDGTGGRIMIDAGVGGTVNAGGTIDASAKGDGKVGGVVMISGESVTVPGGAEISANGEGGGGFVQIGSGEGVDAQSVAVEAGSSISANGGSGPGGMVVISGGADSNVMVAGAVSATSGSGDGGIIIVEGGDVSVTQSSTLDASGANGGVITVTGENSAVVGGTLRSVGNNGNGGMINISGGNSTTVGPTASIDAGGSVNGGMVAISGGGTTSIAGTVSSVGGSGSGGSIQGLGAAVEMAASARVDASGLAGGGQVNIGGGFQGKDPEIQNATNTTVESGARIAADATGDGDGGTVVVWADHDTIFAGDVNARGAGGGQGGFVEISGRNDLAFRGTVDASSPSGRSGTVLFDPGTVNVGNGASTLPVANVNAILDGNTNVIIATHSGDIIFDNLGTGDIRDVSVQWNTDASLGVFASGDVVFENHARTAGAGSVNVIAGWVGDESDALITANDPEAAWLGYVADGAFGIDDGDGATGIGDVYINTTTNTRSVNVGSRYGNTNIAGNNVFVEAPDGGGRYAHLGFRDDGQVFDFGTNYSTATGTDPLVAMVGVAELGDGSGVYMFDSGGATSQVLRYSDHFGDSVDGNWWWRTLDATAGGSSGIGDNLPEMGAGISAELLAMENYGGVFGGAVKADINIEARGSLSVAAGREGSYNAPYAQVGHGGNAHDWAKIGGYSPAANQPYSVNWGGEYRHYTAAMARLAPIFGDINIRTGLEGPSDGSAALTVSNGNGEVRVTGAQATSTSINSFSLIGHGGEAQAGSANGDINIEAGGAIGLDGGWGWNITTSIGHKAGTDNYLQEARTGVGLLADTGWTPDGKLGGGQHKQFRVFSSQAVYDDNTLRAGTLTAAATGAATDTFIPTSAYSGKGTNIYDGATVVTGKGADVFTNLEGDIDAVSHNGGVSVVGSVNTDPARRRMEQASVFIGHGGFIRSSLQLVNMEGDITVRALNGGDVSVIAGNGMNSPYAKIGHGGYVSGSSATSNYLSGDITVDADGDLVIEGGGRVTQTAVEDIAGTTNGFAMVGHGGRNSDTAFKTGDIMVTVGGDLTMTSGAYGGTFAQIGHAGKDSGGQVGGDFSRTIQVADEFGVDQNFNTTINGTTADITVDVAGNILMDSLAAKSTGEASYVQIGHGGYGAKGDKTGDVDVDAGGDLTASGGDRNFKSVRIGHGGYDADGDHAGVITTDAVGAISFIGGTGDYTAAQIGHGGNYTSGDKAGRVDVRGDGIDFTAGQGYFSFANIGHAGRDSSGGFTGNIIVDAGAGTLSFRAGGDSGPGSNGYSWAQIGHGGYQSLGVHDGSIDVDAGEVDFRGGTTGQAYAQLGHGGYNSDSDHTGDIDVSASVGGIRFTGSSSSNSYAQLGHGGNASGGDNDGAITVNASDDILFSAGSGARAHVQIGHGGSESGGAYSGDVYVETDGGKIQFNGGVGGSPTGAYYSYAQIGHGGADADGNHNGAITVLATEDGAGEGIIFEGGDQRQSYVQLGHGGYGSRSGTGGVSYGLNGDIDVSSTGNIRFMAGTLGDAPFSNENGAIYAQLGHGGYDADANSTGDVPYGAIGHNGDISVVASHGSISFLGGDSTRAVNPSNGVGQGGFHYAQLGHGGYSAKGNHFGDIEVRAGIELDGTVNAADGDILFVSGGPAEGAWGDTNSYAQLGNGGREAWGNIGRAGEEIRVMAGRDITFSADPGGSYHYTQLGNGGFQARGDHQGDIVVFAERNILFEGSQNVAGSGTFAADYAFGSSDTASWNASRNQDHAANLGSGGDIGYSFNRPLAGSTVVTIRLDDGTVVGTLSDSLVDGVLVADTDLTADFNGDSVDETITAGTQVGTVTYGNSGVLTFTQDVNPGQNGGTDVQNPTPGDRGTTNVWVAFRHDDSDYSYAQLGHGGYNADNPDGDIALGSVGNITVEARTGSIRFHGGADDTTYAQIGHGGLNNRGANSGAITVTAEQGVHLVGGVWSTAYSQIGHGGYDADGNHTSAIQVSGGLGGVHLNGGLGSYTWAQIGSGGYATNGNHTGTITVDAGLGGVGLAGGEGDYSYAMIGNGGGGSRGDHSGTVTVTSQGDVDLQGGTGTGGQAFAQIGHGGYDSDGDHSGTVTVTGSGGSAVNISGATGTGSNGYAMIGLGGMYNSGVMDGAVFVTSGTGGVNLLGGLDSYFAHAMIGHGGREAHGNKYGDITVTASGGGVSLQGGDGNTYSHAQIGHGGFRTNTATAYTGDVTVNAVDSTVSVLGGSTYGSYAMVGHGGFSDQAQDTAMTGDIEVVADGNILIDAGTASYTFAQIGHGGRDYDGDHGLAGEHISVVSNYGSIELSGGSGSDTIAMIGHGDNNDASGDRTADILVSAATGEISRVSNPNFSFIGHRTTSGTISSDLTLVARSIDETTGDSGSTVFDIDTARGDLLQTALGYGDVSLHATGAGGLWMNSSGSMIYTSVNDFSMLSEYDLYLSNHIINRDAGNVNLVAGWDPVVAPLASGSGIIANVDMDTGIFDVVHAAGNNLGSVYVGSAGAPLVGADRAVTVGSRTGQTNAAGYNVNVWSSPLTIGNYRSANIGYESGAAGTSSAVTGRIRVKAENDVTLIADKYALGAGGYTGWTDPGNANSAHAQIGHGGDRTAIRNKDLSGEIIVEAGNDLIARGANARETYAMVGHGGYDNPQDVNTTTSVLGGNITVNVGNDIDFQGGSGYYGFAQLGHGGKDQRLSSFTNSDIAVTAGGDIRFTGGAAIPQTDNDNHAQLGHGGTNSDVNTGGYGGDITVSAAGSIHFTGGDSPRSYAQIGHGGLGTAGDHSGDITVAAGVDLDLTGVDTNDDTAIIGHGATDGSSTSVAGDVTITAGRDATLVNAYVGNVDASYTSGNTWIGVGNDLTADAASRFNSAAFVAGPPNDGELRVYVGGSDLVDTGAQFNGTAHGAAAFPNPAGSFDFGLGPYPSPAPTVGGNFAYYALDWQGYYNYIVTGTEASNIGGALAGGEVVLSRELGQTAFGALPDFDGGTQFINIDSAINFTSAYDLTLRATGNVTFNAGVQNAGAGAVNVAAGWDGTTDAYDPPLPVTLPPGASNFASILGSGTAWGNNNGKVVVGDGLQTAGGIGVGSAGGLTTVLGYGLRMTGGAAVGDSVQIGYNGAGTGAIDVRTQGGGAFLTGGTGSQGFVQIGHGGYDADGDSTGAISVATNHDVVLTSGGATDAYAQIGHGGRLTDGRLQGDVMVATTGGGVILDSSSGGLRAYAQIGHGGHASKGDKGGAGQSIQVTASDNVDLLSGGGEHAYAQIGHGGYEGDALVTGNVAAITVVGGSDGSGSVRLLGGGVVDTGADRRASTQIGHGGFGAGGDHNGLLSVTAADEVVLRAGNARREFSMIGHGGYSADSFTTGHTGAIDVTATNGSITMGPGPGSASYNFTQIGHGGFWTDGDHGGDITVASGDAISLTGGNGSFSFNQIGHGGYDPTGDMSGATSVTAVNDINVSGGAATAVFAQIGHGGYLGNGSRANDVMVTSTAGDVYITAGSGGNSYAHVGHGGNNTTGDLSGAVEVDADGDITMTGGAGTDANAQIGHGGRLVAGDLAGDICVHADGTVTMDALPGGGSRSYVQIGHGGASSSAATVAGFAGNIAVTTGNGLAGGIALTGGNDAGEYSQIGHGGGNASGAMSGNINAIADNGGNIDITGGTGLLEYAQIGHGDGGGGSSGTRQGGMHIFADGTLTATNGGADNVSVIHQSGVGLAAADMLNGGDGFQIVANNGVNLPASALNGVGSMIGGNMASGLVNFATANDVDIIVDSAPGGLGFDGTTSNDFYILTGGSLTMVRGYRNAGDGDVTLVAGWDGVGYSGSGLVTFTGGDFCQPVVTNTGTLGLLFTCDSYGNDPGSVNGVGTLTIGSAAQTGAVDIGSRLGQNSFAGHGISLRASDTTAGAYSQLGFHPGAAALPATGDIDLHVKSTGLTLASGSEAGSYTQVGHGGRGSTSNGRDADITVTFCEVGDVTFTAGSAADSYAQLGHGGTAVGGTRAGDINIIGSGAGVSAGNVTLSAGSAGGGAYAQIGHGGRSASGAANGSIRIDAANAVSLTGGGDGGVDVDHSYAQIGHGGYDNNSALGLADDEIIVIAQDGISLNGGTTTQGGSIGYFAQIGNGGYESDGALSGDIYLNFDPVTGLAAGGGDLILNGGSGAHGTYAQVGHGGRNLEGAKNGNIMVGQADNVSLNGGANYNYAQIGHGGNDNSDTLGANGNATGTIEVNATAGQVSLAGGTAYSYAQIGHGGQQNDGDFSGAVTVNASNGVNGTAGSSTYSYLQIGHGGLNGDGNHSGAINVDAGAGALGFAGGASSGAYAQIGHGGNVANGDHTGSITTSSSNVVLDGGTSTDTFAQIGHGGSSTTGAITNANITVDATGVIDLNGGSSTWAYAQIGHGGANTNATTVATSNILINSALGSGTGDITLDGNGSNAYAQIGHGGARSDGTTNYGAKAGDITIDKAANIIMTSGGQVDSYTQIGHGGEGGTNGTGTFGIQSGDIVLNSAGGLWLDAGATGAYSQVGHGGDFYKGSTTGNITVTVNGLVDLDGGTGTQAYAQIGHGGRGNDQGGDRSGNIAINQATDVTLNGGTTTDTYAQVGHGGGGAVVNTSGTIGIDASGDIVLAADSTNGYAQVGHGGGNATGTITNASITVDAVGAIDLNADSSGSSYAQIGHGGYNTMAMVATTSNILVNTAAGSGTGDVTLDGGGVNSHAQIGHGGARSDVNPDFGTKSGDVTIDKAANIAVRAGTGTDGYAQIGHGGEGGNGGGTVASATGVITLNSAGDLTLSGGGGSDAYAQVGHGGDMSQGDRSGTITITIAGEVGLGGGTNTDAYAQIGHGGHGNNGNHGVAADEIRVIADSLDFDGGSGSGAYAQLGNGGHSADGAFAGDVLVNLEPINDLPTAGAGALTMDAGSNSNAYVQIGHGGANVNGGANAKSGDVVVGMIASVTMNGGSGIDAFAQIGHGGDENDGAASGSVVVNSAGLVGLGGGSGNNSYVQIGHGGHDATGDFGAAAGNDVLVVVGNGIDLDGGTVAEGAYAQIGFGGRNADGNHAGLIFINYDPILTNAPLGGGAVTLDGGASGTDAYAQIGHGGNDSNAGTKTGGILFGAASDVSLGGGGGTSAYAQVGHGGRGGGGNMDGGISVVATGAVSLLSGSGDDGYTMVGHGGTDATGNQSGDVQLLAAGDVVVTGGGGARTFAQIGNGGQNADGSNGGDVGVASSGGSVLLTAGDSGGNRAAYAQIGNGGVENSGGRGGDITVRAAQDVVLQGGLSTGDYATIGHAGLVGGAGSTGGIRVSAGSGSLAGNPFSDIGTFGAVNFAATNPGAGKVRLLGGAATASDAWAAIGHVGRDAGGTKTGLVDVQAVDDIDMFAGGGGRNFVQVGHGGRSSDGANSGAISLSSLNGGLTLSGGTGAGSEAYAQIGHGGGANFGGGGSDGTKSGTITIGVGGAVDLNGGSGGGSTKYAQIGHGGRESTGTKDGDIAVAAGAGITVDGGANFVTYGQIGHGGHNAGGNHSGLVSARAGGAIAFTAGAATDAYAQFGHGGMSANGDHSGRQEMLADSISFAGGAGDRAYAQFGHGGHTAGTGGSATVGNTGDISLAATTGNITFSGGVGLQAYGQLGHGGYDTTGVNSGNIVARSGGDFLLTPGMGAGAYVQAGHGGTNAAGDAGHTGSLTITAGTFDPDLQFNGVVPNRVYQDVFDVDMDGTIEANGDDDVLITNATAIGVRVGATVPGGAAGAGAYSQIGHGGWNAHGNHGAVPVSDGLRVESTAGLYVYGGGADDASAQIGHGGQNVVGDLSGRIYTASQNDLTVQGGTGARSFAQIGLGGHDDVAGAGNIDGDKNGMIVVFSRLGDIDVTGGTAAGAYGQVGHGGLNNDGDFLHEDLGLFVQSGWNTTAVPPAPATADLTVTSNTGYGMVGSGDAVPAGTGNRIGLVFTNSTGNTSDFGQIGHRTAAGTIQSSGSVNLTAGDYTIGTTGTYKETGAQVAGRVVTADYMVGAGGSIFVNEDVSFASGNDLTLAARDNILVNASIQNSQAAGGGDVSLIAGWDEVTGLGTLPFIWANTPPAGRSFDAALVEADPSSYGIGDGITQGLVRIGDGSQARELAVGSRSGTTRVLGHTLALNAGAGNGDYARIGFQTSAGNTSASGAIKVAMKGAIALAAGPVAGSHAQIGHGSTYLAGGTLGGDISVVSEGLVPLSDITLTGGAGLDNFAQVGHGGVQNTADKGGSILVRTADGDVQLTSGAGEKGYSQVGHGGVNAGAPSTQGGAADLVEVDASGSVTLRASDGGLRAYSQIGNGGFNADAPTTAGDVRVVAGDTVTVVGGAAQQAYGQVGHGGGAADGDKAGVIIVEAGDGLMAGSVALSRGAGSDAYAKIGHGDQAFTSGAVGSASGTIDGGIQVTAGEGMVSTGGMVGHVDPGIGGPAVAGSGSTFVAVSRNDFPAMMMSGDGTLVADAASVFSSGAGGELRFYMPRRDSNQVAAGASLNGTAYIGGLSDPALQRSDEFYTSLGQHTNLNTAAANAAGLVLNLDPVDAANYSTALGDYSFYFDTGTLTPAPDGGGGGGGEEVAPPAPPAPPIFVTIDGQLFFNRGVFGPGSPYVQVGPYAVGFTDDYFNWDAQRYELDMYDSGDKRGWDQFGPWTSTFEAAFSKVEGGAGWSSFTVFGDPDFTVGGYGFGFDGINNPPEMDDELRRMLEALEAELAELRGGE